MPRSKGLPPKGKPIIFGVHRLPPEIAASAPAWKPETEKQRQERFIRETREALRNEKPGNDAPDEAATA